MKIIYTDKNRVEQGFCPASASFDVEVGGNEDFEITVPKNERFLSDGSCWFLDSDKSVGGIVRETSVNTAENEVIYAGKTFRGLLTERILEPPAGEDYLVTAAGTKMNDTLKNIIHACGYEGLFFVGGDNYIQNERYQFYRYPTVLEGIYYWLKKFNKKLVFGYDTEKQMVRISIAEIKEYGTINNKYDYVLKTTKQNITHLICGGKGDLKDREIIHLYRHKDGTINQEPNGLAGTDEIVGFYDNRSAENLLEESIKHYKELIANEKTCEIVAGEDELQVGDYVKCYEEITGIELAKQEVTRKVIKIKNGQIDIDYTVGDSKETDIGESESLEVKYD